MDFLNKNLKNDIKIPKIDYAYINDELSIMGYRKINGRFLNPQIYNKMNEQEKQILKLNIAKFLKDMHNLDFSEIKNYTINNKQNCLEEYELLKKTIYKDLTKKEKNYIENFLETLKRELDEELDVELLNAEFLGGYDDIACFSDEPIHVQTYLAEIKGRIKCKNEIKEAIWIDKNYKEKGIKVGSILGEYVIPNLIERGLM